MLIVGGDDATTTLLTWERSMSTPSAWNLLPVQSQLPDSRVWHSAIYDEENDRVVVFGGDADPSDVNKVWALNLEGEPAWAELLPSGVPPLAREGHAAIYDPVGQRMIIFGGSAAGNLNDVWALSLSGSSAWTNLTPGGPSPTGREFPEAIYDTLRNRMVMFGGKSGSTRLNDAWAFALSSPVAWTQLSPTGDLPPARAGHRSVFDPVADRLVIFGGSNCCFPRKDVWALSFSPTVSWSEITPAGELTPAREWHSMILDPVRNRIVVYGGFGDEGDLADTWSLPLSGPPVWDEWSGGAPHPGRSHASEIYDPIRQRGIIFGGGAFSSTLNDTWELSCVDAVPRWRELSTNGITPAARYGHSAVYDIHGDRMIVFGGADYSTLLNDTWSLSLTDSTWQELSTSGGPPPARVSHSAVFDPGRRRMIIFGGSNAVGVRSDTWALSLGDTPTWTQLAVGGPPPPGRVAHSAILDLARDRMIVFGGSLNRDVWALGLADGGSWQQLTPIGTPPDERHDHVAIYDAARDRMVVYGGALIDIFSYYYRDTWELSLGVPGTWSELLPGGDPPDANWAHAGFFDPVNDRMLVFGGVEEVSETSQIFWGSQVAVPELVAGPPVLVLDPAHPNPMRSTVRIRFTIPEGRSEPARLEILDTGGRLVRLLRSGELSSGPHEISWNGHNDDGSEVAAGVYFYRLSVGERILSRKLIRVR